MEKTYENRELSWLKFDYRVLEEAQDDTVPLYERLKFLSIFHNNLDEFYMVRVGSLCDRLLIKKGDSDKITHMTPKEQLSEIYKRTEKLMEEKDKTYSHVMNGLSKHGVRHESFDKMSSADIKKLEKYFILQVKPLLSPQIVNELHPFPFLQNKAVCIGAQLSRNGSAYYGIIPVFPLNKRIIYLSSKETRFILMEELVEHFADLVFENYTICARMQFRVTRNADVDMNEAFYDEDSDLRDAMTKILKRRTRLNPVRLEVSRYDEEYISWLIRQLNLSKKQVFVENSPLDMSFGFALDEHVDSELKFEPLVPQNSPELNMKKSLIKQVMKRDVLLSYPFENIRQFISLLDECAADPYVTSIKITLYRVASDSKIIDALAKAAENGKEVLVLVELRARFDEENNIGWSEKLEEAGVKVIYGPKYLKVHSKLLLITRKRGRKEKYITQIGTGNYNEKTSKQYTDLSLITANRGIALDAKHIFECLEAGHTVKQAEHLLVAPNLFKQNIIKMIDEQITLGEEGYIGLKFNSLCDKELIDKLLEASQAGVQIEMVIRGICSLVPEIKGKSDNIKLVSIVGRFLEHSRIYVFGKGGDAKVYISSADFMTRNTDRRIEVAAPVYDKRLKQRVINILDTCLSDTVKGRTGRKYKRSGDTDGLNSQEYFYAEAYKNAEKKKGFFARLFK